MEQYSGGYRTYTLLKVYTENKREYYLRGVLYASLYLKDKENTQKARIFEFMKSVSKNTSKKTLKCM